MSTPNYITWQQVREAYGPMGEVKAKKIVHLFDPVYIGRTPLVDKNKIDEHLAKHGEIKIDWRY